MVIMTQEQMQADWFATKNIVRFQELLNGETDDGKYRILAQLLADEFEKFNPPQTGDSRHPVSAVQHRAS